MTRTFVLLGHPVGHSLSPVIHRAAYRAAALDDCRYELLDAPDEAAVEAAFEKLRQGQFAGANVTVPWKRLALKLATRADELAARVGAANVLARDAAGAIVAHNTDVVALRAEFARLVPRARTALVLGNGGAARAVVVACQKNGIANIGVAARSWANAPRASAPSAAEFQALGATPLSWPSGPEDAGFRAWVARSELLVQATSAGMLGADAGTTLRDLIPWEALPLGALAYDLVYNPALTPFLEAATLRGFRSEGGLRMLVGQAAAAIEIWLGQTPALEPLLAAARQKLALATAGAGGDKGGTS